MKINFKKYFNDILEKTRIAYAIAENARKKGFDPIKKVEIPLTAGLAERATGIVSILHPQVKDEKIERRIRELELEYGFLELGTALKIAEEIASQKFCRFSSNLEAIEAGVRLGIAYLTLGIVSSPIEGFIRLEIRKTSNNEDYLAAFFAGPIRSAGGTVAAQSLIIIDYLRQIFGYAKYDPQSTEVKRAITEIYDYHERITNLQYLPSEKEIELIVSNLPIQIEGEASEEIEVSNYKDLPRVSTNRIRSGFCLVLAEGVAAKAPKLIKAIKKLKEKGINIEGFDFLTKLERIKTEKEKEKENKGKEVSETLIAPSSIYIKDMVAGRPILSYPSTFGGFRLRYGRTRTSGYSAMAVNPALTYCIDFLAIGTQLRTERPGKSCSLATCEVIDGPIVKLDDGSVIKINNVEQALKYRDKIKEIIYLGDLLISFGDFFNRNHLLMPAGYVEEWWFSEFKDFIEEITTSNKNIEEVNEAQRELNNLKDYNYFNLSLEKAIELSLKYNLPLYPKYIFYWSQINLEQLKELLKWLKNSYFSPEGNLILSYSKTRRAELEIAKRALEIAGVEHSVSIENVIIKKDEAKALLLNIGILHAKEINENIDKINSSIKERSIDLLNRLSEEEKKGKKSVLDFINTISDFKIRDKAGTFIGARMGRPEKAKPRVLTGQPNVLFPVGDEGGRLRSFDSAKEKGFIKAEFPIFYCNKCKSETIYFVCEKCNNETEKRYYCNECNKTYSTNICKAHGLLKLYKKARIDINYYFDKAIEKLGLSKLEIPDVIKGVKGTSSENHITEHLAKGILRSIYNLHVNKDGTIRYDATELPITHFKPREIGTSIEKLKELGYTHDCYGNPLVNDDQLLILMPQDIILPSTSESKDESADSFLLRVSKFIDSLLVRFYNTKPFYNAEKKEDLIGQLVICIAPHNAAGTIARIIGFSDTQTFLASPFLHAAMRRDCDGDEAGFMLLLDALINFSFAYLPSHRGATQDVPVIINSIIRQNEVDDMVFDMENTQLFPKEFYYATLEYKSPLELKIPQVKNNLSVADAFIINFTHPTQIISAGNKCSAYKSLATMKEKVEKQMDVGIKIRAVDASDLAMLIITKHFIRDIRGNLRKFSSQQFRCSKCNAKYRRPPLAGKCLECGGPIIFTIAEGTIRKYLEPALALAQKYNVKDYVKQNLKLVELNINELFGKEQIQQKDLKKWL
ncbi:MAG: DNA polymerase II large subunit [Candidatus Pacearchaeota archaeon]